MTEARVKHSATLLLDGTVLVAGSGLARSAERYDPASGTWTATRRMTEFRSNYPKATRLLDGRILMIDGGEPGSAEIYDPSTGSWARIEHLLLVRYDATATLLLDGTVLVAGGYGDGESGSSAELYRPPN